VDLEGFSSDTPVNTESHFPQPDGFDGGIQDPFDVSSLGLRTRYHTSPVHLEPTNSSDDPLGILAQPVEAFEKRNPPSPKPQSPKPASPQPASRQPTDDSSDEDSVPRDKAIAAIVEMGFSIGQATKALAQTPSGIDVQAALEGLLSRPSSSASTHVERRPPERRQTPNSRLQTPNGRWQPPHSAPSRTQQQLEDRSQMTGFRTSLLKGAGTLWKQGREKMNTILQEYQSEQEDPSVPKWMRDQQRYAAAGHAEVTEEARALEARREPLQVRNESTERPVSAKDRLALRKQAEEEAAVAYKSSARRQVPSRINTPVQDPPSRTTAPPVNPAVNLFSSTTEDIAKPGGSKPASSTPLIISKPNVPKPLLQRMIPPTSDLALSSSHIARQKGSEAFQVGDYTLALTHYATALTPLPSTHPQRILILSNRAITNLKLGDAKAAITDCNDLISLVGPSRGEGESVVDIDGQKDLRDIWGKGVVRRAMGLEVLEKYKDALEMWRLAVDAGIGGQQSLEGRRRCENVITPKKPTQTTTPITRSMPSQTPTPSTRKGPSAIAELAAYNTAAAADEDQRTHLYDSVEAKITQWQTSKESNLRALLSSLDSILWPETGWKKVSMAELVIVNKVKVIYMKAIAKVHPDKVRPEIEDCANYVSLQVGRQWSRG
jgi:hypothetical protein